MSKFNTDEVVLPDRSNEFNLGKGINITLVNQPGEISINAEYFRPKFEEILNKYFSITPYASFFDYEDTKKISDQLMECLKNPEGK